MKFIETAEGDCINASEIESIGFDKQHNVSITLKSGNCYVLIESPNAYSSDHYEEDQEFDEDAASLYAKCASFVIAHDVNDFLTNQALEDEAWSMFTKEVSGKGGVFLSLDNFEEGYQFNLMNKTKKELYKLSNEERIVINKLGEKLLGKEFSRLL